MPALGVYTGRVGQFGKHAGFPMWKVGNLNPVRVKPITYQIDTCRYPAWCSTLTGYGKDWLAQYQYNVILGLKLGNAASGAIL